MISKPFIHVVLVEPKMPSNTGNIIRLCANTGAQLHLVQPLAFELDDKKLRRAGLDYHEYASMQVHANWQVAKAAVVAQQCETFFAMTTKAKTNFFAQSFVNSSVVTKPASVALVFGSETAGLSDAIRTDIGTANWLKLPMQANSRSLNLANSVAIAVYEVWRQFDFARLA